jgi:thiol:disulfide interchange protein DsbD
VIKAKYPSYQKCANNINCFKDYYEGLSYARETGKPMLIDFTGHGCVNCRKTEEHIWVDPSIRKNLNDDVVLVSLYVDDDKKLPTTLVSKSRGNKIRNVGNLWADFQIVNFEQNSQPLYVMVDPNSEQVLTQPRPFKEGIKGYQDFLDCGRNAHSGGKQ